MAQQGLGRMLEHFWHPVCAADQLAGPAGCEGPVPVRLLGRSLVVALDEATGLPFALDDRCLHRSTPLSLGKVEPAGIRCAHHGWLWGTDGSCREVPGQSLDALPRRARIGSYATRVDRGLVWVRLDDSADIPLPPFVPGADPEVVCAGHTGDQPVGALRRVEHLADWALPAWGVASPARQVAPQRQAAIIAAETGAATETLGLRGADRTTLRIHLPTVVEFEVSARGGRTRTLWAVATPTDHGMSRLHWVLTGHEVTPDDARYVADQLAQRERIETSKQPAEITLDRLTELSSRGDRVSVAYRRALEDLAEASRRGPQLLTAALRTAVA